MNYFIILLLSIAFALSSCKQVQKSSVAESSVSKELENQKLQLDSTWNVMFQSDDNKIENLNRLVKELQMIDGSNSGLLTLAEKEIQSIKGFRYDQNSMRISRSIDIYDSVTNVVIQKLRNETNQNPNAIKYQIVNQLISEIQLADDSILFYRKEYDRTVDSYNNFLKTRNKDLKKSGINVDSLKPYPVFRLLM
jgi:hypothetical protein